MRKFNLLFVLLFGFLFFVFGCACMGEETVSKQEALDVLKSVKYEENVKVTTTTKTIVNNEEATSIQTDYYYKDKYYHVSESEQLSTKTWYGYIEDVLYAFYYTKNSENVETKTSSRIEFSQLEDIKKQPSNIITTLIKDDGSLVEGFDLTATKIGQKYTIQISKNSQEESDIYTIIILDQRVTQIEKNTGAQSDSITTIYTYEYDINDFELPSLNDYPLNVNN